MKFVRNHNNDSDMVVMCIEVINKCTARVYIWQSERNSGQRAKEKKFLKVSLVGINVLRVLLIVDHVKGSWVVLIGIEVIARRASAGWGRSCRS